MTSAQLQEQRVDLLGRSVPWAEVKGFNYMLSAGSTGLEEWERFDADVVTAELMNGRRHFPHINAVRVWLSWDFFQLNPQGFLDRFETLLTLCAGRDLAVMPVLFNRWHAPVLDWGGVYLDHFVPHASWVQTPTMWTNFIDAVVGAHIDDPRIFLWDVCNEPFATMSSQQEMGPVLVDAELAWLRHIAERTRAVDPGTPVGISIHVEHGPEGLRQVEPLIDVLLVHPYYDNRDDIVDHYVAISEEVGKPLLATEACWGSQDDEVRVGRIHSNLALLSEKRIGWLAYTLCHTDAADGHRAEHGLLDKQGTLHFIEKNGSLRPGHEAFNLY